MIDQLIDKIREKKNPTVAGLDTKLDYLPEAMRQNVQSFSEAANAITTFNKELIDALWDVVPAVKIQVAYYEMYSVAGMQAFYETAAYASSKGLIVIADVKRNDIGSTAQAYAEAYLGQTDLGMAKQRAFSADFCTVNPYLGSDGILPFVHCCKEYDKGIFVLVKNSNPSSGELQDIVVNGKPIYCHMGDKVAEWGKEQIGSYGYSNVGAVVGATYPEQGKELRENLSSVFFLIPGYGAQGATGKDIAQMFDAKGNGGIVNASRSLLCAYKKEAYAGLDFQTAARKEALRMQDDLCSNIKGL